MLKQAWKKTEGIRPTSRPTDRPSVSNFSGLSHFLAFFSLFFSFAFLYSILFMGIWCSSTDGNYTFCCVVSASCVNWNGSYCCTYIISVVSRVLMFFFLFLLLLLFKMESMAVACNDLRAKSWVVVNCSLHPSIHPSVRSLVRPSPNVR